MSLSVVLRDEAQAEFDEAFDYYEGRRTGLGVAFVMGGARKAASGNPARPTRVQIIAVFHSSRDPATWQGRV